MTSDPTETTGDSFRSLGLSGHPNTVGKHRARNLVHLRQLLDRLRDTDREAHDTIAALVWQIDFLELQIEELRQEGPK